MADLPLTYKSERYRIVSNIMYVWNQPISIIHTANNYKESSDFKK